MRHWDVSHVSGWLRSMGVPFAAYVGAFEANAVNGAVLFEAMAEATAAAYGLTGSAAATASSVSLTSFF